MKNHSQGPSLYFATDKNIFDALNQRKVDNDTIMRLFEERNIVVSPKTPREDLARYFARLAHDFEDHRRIAARLGIVARRERITAMEVAGVNESDALTLAVNKLKDEHESLGDVVQVTRDGENVTVTLEYSTVDYSRTEMSQVQRRDGIIEFVKTGDGYTVRSTQNEHIVGVRDELLERIEKANNEPITRSVVSLGGITSATLRSKFFYDLMNAMPDFSCIDVLAIYVYKPKPTVDPDAADSLDDGAKHETHVEKVSMRGIGVSESEMLQVLTADDYYITKVVWTTSKVLSTGAVYEVEAAFEDPRECAGFSFILSGVYAVEGSIVSTRKRTPHSAEVDMISKAVDMHSRSLVTGLGERAK